MNAIKSLAEIKAIFSSSGSEEMFDRAAALLRLAAQGDDLYILHKGVYSALNPHEEDEDVVNSYREVASTHYWGDFYSMVGPFAEWDTDVLQLNTGENWYSNMEYQKGSKVREQWVFMPVFMRALDWLITNIEPMGSGWKLTSGKVEPLRFNQALLAALLEAIDGAEEITSMPKNGKQAAAMGLDPRFF